ncbi:Protein of unknown function (DUF3074) [Teratosphaeria destructans]|uniref:DUF3074 domain-containing protein n=1 Tax=Teratosphaeria destructans TaxID=418781 RepID=A0A9W7SKC2_9PEZI|nr:Protein of unknown function (DUF3074) [Teratosphaeria destructans]
MAPDAPTTATNPLISMRALPPHHLPSHPSLRTHQPSTTTPSPTLLTFLTSVLTEAESFLTTYLPTHFHPKGTKTSPPAHAPVHVLAHDRPGSSSSAAEAWFARTSVHENAAEEGTASWEEFDGALRVDHSQHEKDYTPDVQDAHQVLAWDISDDTTIADTWRDVTMHMMEMRHKIPPPLSRRVFSVLVITARSISTSAPSFLVVQIPVDLTGVSGSKFWGDKKVVQGVYCSIERAELVEAGRKVRWQMATASDAKGVLPMVVQKMAVPGAVVKDVGLVVGWVGGRRGR